MNSESFILCGVILVVLILFGAVSTNESPIIKNEKILI